MRLTLVLAVCATALAVSAGATPPKVIPKTITNKPMVHTVKIVHRKHPISAGQAEAIVLKKYPGKVVGPVTKIHSGKAMRYAVTVRTKGDIIKALVAAQSGKIVSVVFAHPKVPKHPHGSTHMHHGLHQAK